MANGDEDVLQLVSRGRDGPVFRVDHNDRQYLAILIWRENKDNHALVVSRVPEGLVNLTQVTRLFYEDNYIRSIVLRNVRSDIRKRPQQEWYTSNHEPCEYCGTYVTYDICRSVMQNNLRRDNLSSEGLNRLQPLFDASLEDVSIHLVHDLQVFLRKAGASARDNAGDYRMNSHKFRQQAQLLDRSQSPAAEIEDESTEQEKQIPSEVQEEQIPSEVNWDAPLLDSTTLSLPHSKDNLIRPTTVSSVVSLSDDDSSEPEVPVFQQHTSFQGSSTLQNSPSLQDSPPLRDSLPLPEPTNCATFSPKDETESSWLQALYARRDRKKRKTSQNEYLASLEEDFAAVQERRRQVNNQFNKEKKQLKKREKCIKAKMELARQQLAEEEQAAVEQERLFVQFKDHLDSSMHSTDT